MTVVFEDRLEVPHVASLEDFRRWARSPSFPDSGRIDFIDGRVEVDMTPEDLFTHGTVKTEIVGVLSRLVKRDASGHLFTDSARISAPRAGLSAEPDVVFLAHDSLDRGSVRLVPSAGGEAGRFVEIEGGPDLIVEIVSDSSPGKDTRRLPPAYHRAGVRELWIVDARREDLVFEIRHRGAESFDPAPVDAEGFAPSSVFAQEFRLDRTRDARGLYAYDLRNRPRTS